MNQLERLKAEEAELEAAHFGNPEVETEVQPPVESATIEEHTEMREIIVPAEPTTEEPVVEAEPAYAPKPRTNWKKRYSNYKASTDATIYELRNEVASLKSELAQAITMVNELRSKPAEPQGDPWEGTFSQEDVDTFGADGLEVVKKAASSLVEKQVAPLKEQLKAQEDSRAKELQRSATAEKQRQYKEFLGRLETLVPDYADINVNRNFLEWMKLPDTYSGITRADLFKKAEASFDVSRVAEFFVEFKELSKPKDDPLPREVEEHIMPKGSGSASPVPQATNTSQDVVYTSEINKFYDDVMKGRYAGREAEIRNIEAQIERAHAEGRIIQG